MNIELAVIFLKIGLGVAFILMGGNILKEIGAWAKFYDESGPDWIKSILPVSGKTLMLLTGYYDIANGVWLFTPWLTFLSALLAAVHLVQVLLVTGIKSPDSFRDVGLFFCSIALFVLTFPH
jgi:hypothetical protein